MSEMLADITIVIPVYNGEKYIVRCLDSIYGQKFSKKLEVIVVDDASVDNSLKLMKEYQSIVPSLKIIEHDTNRCLSVARTNGMKASTGDYVLHVDADDWLLDGSIESMYNKIVDTQSDVLVFNYINESIEGRQTLINSIEKIFTTNDKDEVHPYFLATAWNKLVKRSLTENLIYGNVSINSSEDLLYATEIILKADKVCLIPESYYVYFGNVDSLTKATNPDKYLNSQIIVLEQVRLITLNYGAGLIFTNNVLTHIEKHIFFAIARSHFLFKAGYVDYIKLINAFKLFPGVSVWRLNTLSLSMSNKYFSLIPVLFRFGFKTVISIILKSIQKYMFIIKFNFRK